MGNAFASCQACSILQCDQCAEVLSTRLRDERLYPAPNLSGAGASSAWASGNAGQDYQPANISEAELMRMAQQQSLIEAGITPSPEDAAQLARIARANVISPSLRDAMPLDRRGGSPQSEEELLAAAIRASEQEDREQLRLEQASEYEESLRIDREREDAKRKKQQEEEEKQRAIEEEEQRRLKEKEDAQAKAKEEEEALRARTSSMIESARSRLSDEPPADEAGRVMVRIRTPEGKALKRAFRSTDPVSQVYDFTLAEGGDELALQDFRLIATMPRAVYEEKQATLGEVGLQGQCALLVEIIEPDE